MVRRNLQILFYYFIDSQYLGAAISQVFHVEEEKNQLLIESVLLTGYMFVVGFVGENSSILHLEGVNRTQNSLRYLNHFSHTNINMSF